MFIHSFILALLIVLSGLFSASEIALVTITPSKVRELIAKNCRGAQSIENLKKKPQKFLITILVASNVVNIFASVYATVVFTNLFSDKGAGIAFGLMTLLILIFGDLAPKTLGHRYYVSVALLVAKPLLFLEAILTPINWCLEKIVSAITFFTGDKGKQKSMTEDELRAMVNLGAEEGSLEKHEKELIENVLEFNDIQAIEVMTPRMDVVALDANTTIQEATKFLTKNMHTRIPVYQNNRDNIIGILSIKELLLQLAEKNLEATLDTIELLPVIQVPTTRKIHQLFKDFQRKRIHMGIVIDEHGSMVGIVTMEDVLEEIVGEIADEYDVIEELIKKIDNKKYLVKGKTPIYDISKELKVKFDNVPDYKPVSFLILDTLKRFPKTGEKIKIRNITFQVEKMEKKRIELLRVTKK